MTPTVLADITHLTFDCYGTLIDWESGILGAIRPALSLYGVHASDEEILSLYSELESRLEIGEYRSYREVLRGVMRGFAERFGVAMRESELDRLPDSIAKWPAFADVPPALAWMRHRFGLVVLSNIDNDLFAATQPKLGVEFDYVVTAELCRSYKPSPRHFRVGLALMELEPHPHRVLHVAESLYHDVPVAKSLGMRTCWVNRRAGRAYGASKAPLNGPTPDLEVSNLAELVKLLPSGGPKG